jgi:AP2-associated kinase
MFLLQQESMVVGDYNIRVQHLLAEGGFSQVFLVKDGASGKAMALKRVLCQSDEAEKDAVWEIKVHKVRLPIPCVGRLFSHF